MGKIEFFCELSDLSDQLSIFIGCKMCSTFGDFSRIFSPVYFIYINKNYEELAYDIFTFSPEFTLILY